MTLFLIGADLFVVSPLLPGIASEFHHGVALAGSAVSAFALAYVLAGPRLGSVADRVGRRKVLAAGLAGFALANLLSSVAPDFPALVVSRGLAGVSASAVTPSVYALVGASAPEGRQATWLGVVTSGLLLALVIAAPLGAIVAQRFGWHSVFGGLAALATALTLIESRERSSGVREQSLRSPNTVRFPQVDGPDECRREGAVAGGGPSTVSRPEAARPARTLITKLLAVAPTALWGYAVYGPYTFLGAVLRSEGFAPTAIALAVAVFGAGALVGNLAGGLLSDRAGAKSVSAASFAVLGAAQIAGELAARRLAPETVVLGMLGLGAYPYYSAHQSRLANQFPRESASMLAWNNSALYAGILAGSAVGGWILSRAGYSALDDASAGAAACGAALALAWSSYIPALRGPGGGSLDTPHG